MALFLLALLTILLAFTVAIGTLHYHGIARLKRANITCTTLKDIPQHRRMAFLDSLGLEVLEPAIERVVTEDDGLHGGRVPSEDTIKRFGGPSAPTVPWPKEHIEEEEADKLAALENKLMKVVKSGKAHRNSRTCHGGSGGEGSGPRPLARPLWDVLWQRLASYQFMASKIYFLLTLCLFVVGQAALFRHSSEQTQVENVTMFCCRLMNYVASLGPLTIHEVRQLVADEPFLYCLSDKQGITMDCQQGRQHQDLYSGCAFLAMIIFWIQLLDLAIFSEKIMAYVLVCSRLVADTALFLLALLTILLAFTAAIGTLHYHGIARLKRANITCATLKDIPQHRRMAFLDSLGLEEPLEFNEGDVGIAGGIQVLELASERDTIKRFGGPSAPSAPWPKEHIPEEEVDKLASLEKKLMKVIKSKGKAHRPSRNHGSGGSMSEENGRLTTSSVPTTIGPSMFEEE
eukprot:g29373.t3